MVMIFMEKFNDDVPLCRYNRVEAGRVLLKLYKINKCQKYYK